MRAFLTGLLVTTAMACATYFVLDATTVTMVERVNDLSMVPRSEAE
jgi:hypothetical protein